MNCGVYQIENLINGKLYIGSSNQIERRFYLHKWDLRRGKHHSITLQRAWDKYGESAFNFSVIIYCAPDVRQSYEQIYLDRLETVNPEKGYNICCDAVAAGMGRVWTDEQRKAKSRERKGKKLSPEAYKTLLSTRKSGQDHWFYGKRHTKESLKKISIALKGRVAWNKGKPQPPSCSQAKITAEQVFEIRSTVRENGFSRKILSQRYGLKPDTIWKICSGRLWPNVGGLPCLPI